MQKLFALSHLRTLQRLGLTEYVPSNFDEVMLKNNLVASGEALLFRLPREELKHVLNTQCPVNSLEETHAEEIIKSSKALRHHVKYEEAKICAKCPLVEQCKFAKKPWEGKYENTSKDLVNFFHGLNNLLTPDRIFYRQWVSAYRLGDSLIAAIDDLSKGGKEIEEYDRIRLEGIREFEQKVAQKKKERSEMGDSDQEFEKVMSRVDSITTEKRKAEKPKEEVRQRSRQEVRQEPQATLGRDFSFDEEQEFQPTKKFTKKSAEEQPKSSQSFRDQKGYQRIEQNDERQPRYQNNQAPKAPYNKFRSQREAPEEFSNEDRKYQPKQDKFPRRDYNDRGGEDRGYKSQWNAPRDNRSSGGYQRDQQQGNRYNDRDQTSRGEQSSYNNKYNSSYNPSYNSKPRYVENEDHPRIREFGKKSQNQNQYNTPRDNYSQDPSKAAPKANPYVAKWKPSNEQNAFPQTERTKPTFKRGGDFEGKAAEPRIISMQPISSESTGTEGSSGRAAGRRRRSPRSNSDEQ